MEATSRPYGQVGQEDTSIPFSHGQADCAHNYPQDPHSLCSLKVAATM